MRALLLLPLLALALDALGQVAIVSRSSYVREAPEGDAAECFHAEAGDTLVLADTDDHDGYYHVRAPGNCSGYVYRNRVRLRNTDLPVWARSGSNPGPTPGPGPGGNTTTTGMPRNLNACSFNIKFIGQGNKKQYQPLVDMLKDYDLVLVQELVSAPIDFTYGSVLMPSTQQARTFFQLMADNNFVYALSTEKTGKNGNRTNGSQSEYFVAFYKPGVLEYNSARSGFVAQPLVLNTTFDRVPWTFNFTTRDRTLDFDVTNVHLAADENADDQRKRELAFIAQHVSTEPDQIILGDMNIQDCDELNDVMPNGYSSLNRTCIATNVGTTGKPFDHVMYRAQHTANDIDPNYFRALDLVELMKPSWDPTDGDYPGLPGFNVATYGAYYSDHKPVEFRLIYGVRDDDP